MNNIFGCLPMRKDASNVSTGSCSFVVADRKQNENNRMEKISDIHSQNKIESNKKNKENNNNNNNNKKKKKNHICIKDDQNQTAHTRVHRKATPGIPLKRMREQNQIEETKMSARDEIEEKGDKGIKKHRNEENQQPQLIGTNDKNRNNKDKKGEKQIKTNNNNNNNNNKGRKKGLRKREKSRGHGTLNYLDMEHAKHVDTNQIDIKSTSIQQEFGTFGALPVGSRKLWQLVLKMSRNAEPETFSLRLQPSTYKLIVNLQHSRGSFIADSKVALVKVWLLNRRLGHSKIHQVTKICNSKPRFEFDLVIKKEDCAVKVMELRVQIIPLSSKFSYSPIKVQIQLHKLKQNADSLADIIRDVVLDGDDQTEMIRLTRTERAKSVSEQRRKKQLEKRKQKRSNTHG